MPRKAFSGTWQRDTAEAGGLEDSIGSSILRPFISPPLLSSIFYCMMVALKSFTFLLSQFFTHREWPFSMFRNVKLLSLLIFIFIYLVTTGLSCVQYATSWISIAACGIFSCSMQTLNCGMWDLVP